MECKNKQTNKQTSKCLLKVHIDMIINVKVYLETMQATDNHLHLIIKDRIQDI